MSDPIKFPQVNTVLNKPDSMTEEECAPLHCHDTGTAFVSCWRLTSEEMETIRKTGVVWLWVHGRGHPPVSVGVGSPFVDGT